MPLFAAMGRARSSHTRRLVVSQSSTKLPEKERICIIVDFQMKFARGESDKAKEPD